MEHWRPAIGLIFTVKRYHNIQIPPMAIMHRPSRPGEQMDQEDVNLPQTERNQTIRP